MLHFFLYLIYYLGIPVTAMFWMYWQGYINKRFIEKKSNERPPVWIGALLSPLWPLQVAVGIIVVGGKWAYGLGDGRGLHINSSIAEMLKERDEIEASRNAILLQIQQKGLDPNDELGLAALTRGTVERALAKEETERLQAQEPEVLGSTKTKVPLTKERHSSIIDLSEPMWPFTEGRNNELH